MKLHAFKKILLPFSLAFTLLMAGPAMAAGDSEPFSPERFEALQDQGAKILVDIGASWCPDCQKQQVVLGEYQETYPDADLHILRVDFDDQKQWVTHFKAPRQSTLILFDGKEQVWFSVAETRKDRIFAALNAI